MINQPFLFDPDVAVLTHAPAGARRTDPETSREAAEAVHSDGSLTAARMAVLQALRRFPGSTSRELSERAGLDRHDVARRLPELERLGFVQKGEPRVCSASAKRLRAVTWQARVER